MEVVIIGAGNVGTILSKLIVNKGHNVKQVFSSRLSNAILLSDQIGSQPIDNLDKINHNADIYIIAVVDDVIPLVAKSLKLDDKLVFHTSGTISKDVLKTCSTNYGVLWPIQTLKKEVVLLNEIPFVIDGSNEAAITAIEGFASGLSASVIRANDNQKEKLHLAAVFASNFANHCFVLAEKYCQKENLDFNMLIPLIAETAGRIKNYSPSDVQTGPAARKDIKTLEKQRINLKKYPYLQELYVTMSLSIMRIRTENEKSLPVKTGRDVKSKQSKEVL